LGDWLEIRVGSQQESNWRRTWEEQAEQLRGRTEEFALRILRLFRSLPNNEEARIIGRQVLRSGTSVAANYRAACRSRTKAEFISKICLVAEEADETLFWLEFLVDGEVVGANKMQSLLAEAGELVAIFSASRRTARRNAGRSVAAITKSPNHSISKSS